MSVNVTIKIKVYIHSFFPHKLFDWKLTLHIKKQTYFSHPSLDNKVIGVNNKCAPVHIFLSKICRSNKETKR